MFIQYMGITYYVSNENELNGLLYGLIDNYAPWVAEAYRVDRRGWGAFK